jgi:hypothetical protein
MKFGIIFLAEVMITGRMPAMERLIMLLCTHTLIRLCGFSHLGKSLCWSEGSAKRLLQNQNQPPMPDPNEEELRLLKEERTVLQEKRSKLVEDLNNFRADRDVKKRELLNLNQEIIQAVSERKINEERLKEINERIKEL